jgi:DNA-binding transcriptional LysR family regulator
MRPPAHQLEYFVAVAEEGQFTRAAERLHVAQPSISAQIRRLEKTLGAPLFHRGPGPVTLTDAGQALLPLAEVVQGVADLESLQRGRVAIGATPSLSAALLPHVLGPFHERFGGVELRVTEAGSPLLVAGIESGELDLALAILPLPAPTLDCVSLAVEELVVVTSGSHPLAARSRIAIKDLREVPLVFFREGYDLRASALQACQAAGFAPIISVEGGEMGGVLALVAAGLGAAIVPSIVASDPRLHVLEIRPHPLTREIGLVRRADRRPSRAAAALHAEVLNVLATRGWPSPVPARVIPRRQSEQPQRSRR